MTDYDHDYDSLNRPLTDEDREHIRRLRATRDSGAFNMFTELRHGLRELFDEDGEETYQWVTDNWEFYQSGEWTED